MSSFLIYHLLFVRRTWFGFHCVPESRSEDAFCTTSVVHPLLHHGHSAGYGLSGKECLSVCLFVCLFVCGLIRNVHFLELPLAVIFYFL